MAQYVRYVIIGSLMLGFGGSLFLIIVTLFFPWVGLNVGGIEESDTKLFVGFIGAVITIFSSAFMRNQNRYIKNQEKTDKKIDNLNNLVIGIKAPIDEKIESRKQKDIDQDKHIAENKKEIEKLQLRMKEVEKDMKELKDHVDKRFDKLEELIKELVKK